MNFSQFQEALNDYSLETRPGDTLPDAEQVFEDANGVVTLGIAEAHYDESTIPVFDIRYQYADQNGSGVTYSLLDLMPPGYRFSYDHTLAGAFADIRHQKLLLVDPETLMQRSLGLTALAHEIGHTWQEQLGDTIHAVISAGGSMNRKQEERLTPYSPAIDHLQAYIRRQPSIIDDLIRAREIVEQHPDGMPCNGLTDETCRTLATALVHPEAHVGITAILEADAWVAARGLIRNGKIHPGLPETQLAQLALPYVRTYDNQSPGGLHEKTFLHAMHV